MWAGAGCTTTRASSRRQLAGAGGEAVLHRDPAGSAARHAQAALPRSGRKLLDIADEALDGSTLDGASIGDFLLEELDRSRDTHMRDIVATIQADQYRPITHAPEQPLVIQGGPGTGKTAVGLHRA